METYCIYCYTNNINGKKYIGQTKDVSKRCHKANYKNCIKFYSAIEKYGYENFSFEILENNLTLEEANKKEEKYISFYNTVEEGYNIKSGGLNNIYSQESKEKMRISNKSKKRIRCIETNQEFESAKEIERILGFANSNIIACCKGKLHTAYGYTWEYMNQSSAIQRTDKRKRGVICIDLNQYFSSAAEASRTLNISRPNITNCCQGKLKSAGGYRWKYANLEE